MMVTGASGFLGRAIVEAACREGWEVVALCRPTSAVPGSWLNAPQITLGRVDLSEPQGAGKLAALLEGISCVIHAAATLSGSDAEQARDTIQSTRALIQAMRAHQKGRGQTSAVAQPVRLILVSSFSVYDFARLPDHAVLDEATPIEASPGRRDAYCRAKLAQEAIVQEDPDPLDLCLARPGAIYGPERLWSWQLGIPAAGFVLSVDGASPVPAISVDRCALALARLAGLPSSALPAIINLVDPDPPSQREWLDAMGQRRVVYMNRRVFMGLVTLLDRLVALWPAFGRLRPKGLRPENIEARFKPLRYDTQRAMACLGLPKPEPFAQRLRAYRGAQPGAVAK